MDVRTYNFGNWSKSQIDDTRMVSVPSGVGLDEILESLFVAVGGVRFSHDNLDSFVDVKITVTGRVAHEHGGCPEKL